MRRFRSGYSGYRGRKTLNEILRIIAIFLGVVLAVVLVSLMLGQDYIVFTDRGPQLDLPFFRQTEDEPSASGDISVVVEPNAAQSQQDPVPAAAWFMGALELPVDAVLDQTAADRLEQAGADALVLEMKTQQGTLSWTSELGIAARAGVNARAQGINEALAAWNQGDIYTVARVSCFRDNTVPYHFNDMALRATYGNWRDELGLRWLNPDSAAAREYLAALCAELARLGFDEILLEGYAFPYEGRLDAIVQQGSYQSGEFAQAAQAFLEELSRALEPYDSVLSLRVNRNMLTGGDTLSGMTADGLERLAGRIWMLEDDIQPALLDLLAAAEISEPEMRLVRETAALHELRQGAQAVLG